MCCLNFQIPNVICINYYCLVATTLCSLPPWTQGQASITRYLQCLPVPAVVTAWAEDLTTGYSITGIFTVQLMRQMSSFFFSCTFLCSLLDSRLYPCFIEKWKLENWMKTHTESEERWRKFWVRGSSGFKLCWGCIWRETGELRTGYISRINGFYFEKDGYVLLCIENRC
jgi:hypothetical protein